MPPCLSTSPDNNSSHPARLIKVNSKVQWDHRNRLIKVTDKDGVGTTTQVVEYEYDVFDRRIEKAVDTTSPFTMTDAVIERYVYDDINGVTSIDGGNVVLDFVDPDGTGTDPVALEKRYLYGNDVDQILAQEDVTETPTTSADRVYWHLVDNLGTVRDLAKNDGTLGEHYKYDSYGQVTSGDTSVTRYLFTGREFDDDVELQYSRARWYDGATGRWIAEDPLGFDAGDSNLNRYVRNRSVNATDPSGLFISQDNMFGGGTNATVKEGLDAVQTTLDVAGLTPGLGIVPDAANTVISIVRGDLTAAGMNAMAMIPLLGQGTKGAQLAVKAGTLAADASKAVDKVADAAKVADKAGEVVKPAKKHTPGRGHRRKSEPAKQKRFQKKARQKREEAEAAYRDAIAVWERMSQAARKLRPDLHPDNFKP